MVLLICSEFTARSLLPATRRLWNAYHKAKNLDNRSVVTFDTADTDDSITHEWPDINEYDSRLLIAMEKETMGLYVSGHPLDEFQQQIKDMVTVYSYDFELSEEEQSIETRIKDGQFARVAES